MFMEAKITNIVCRFRWGHYTCSDSKSSYYTAKLATFAVYCKEIVQSWYMYLICIFNDNTCVCMCVGGGGGGGGGEVDGGYVCT